MVFTINNPLGFLSFLSILVLIILYLVKPKPFKKVIPSLIFLESGKKRRNVTYFLQKFVKDWLFFLQLLIILLLCFSALDLSMKLSKKTLRENAIFVIDASASSQVTENNKMMIDYYKDYAKSNLGVKNSIILIKNKPEVIAKNTNPINAYRLINSIKPSESLSNVWDAMMLSSEINDNSQIFVLSDFIDSNDKDIKTAKKIIEAKGHDIELINFRKTKVDNIGIIKYKISNNNVTIDLKNYGESEKEITIDNSNLKILPNSVEQVSFVLNSQINKIKIDTNDNFEIDDVITIIKPKDNEQKLLFVTNEKSTFLFHALSSIKNLKVEKAEPPIIKTDDIDIYVFDSLDYTKLLPGTIDEIKQNINQGSSLIIANQDKLDVGKIQNLISLNLINEKKADIQIYNSKFEQFSDYNFGLSNTYYESSIKNNNSIVIASAADDFDSPIIGYHNLGFGKVFFYGINDKFN